MGYFTFVIKFGEGKILPFALEVTKKRIIFECDLKNENNDEISIIFEKIANGENFRHQFSYFNDGLRNFMGYVAKNDEFLVFSNTDGLYNGIFNPTITYKINNFTKNHLTEVFKKILEELNFENLKKYSCSKLEHAQKYSEFTGNPFIYQEFLEMPVGKT